MADAMPAASRESAAFVRLLQTRSCALFVCAFWLAVTVGGMATVTRAFGSMSTKFSPLPGSTGAQALSAASAAFPARIITLDTFALLYTRDRRPVPPAAVANLTASLASVCAPFAGALLDGPHSSESLRASGWLSEAATLLSSDASAAAVAITTRADDPVLPRLISRLQRELPRLMPPDCPDCQLDLTGAAVMTLDTASHTEEDVVRSDEVALPISLALLALALAPRIILLTVAALAAALGASALVLWLIASRAAVPAYTPSLVVSAVVATSIDYSLFLVSALRAQLRRAASAAEAAGSMGAAVCAMLDSTGCTVAVSGVTLGACFFAQALFPVSLLRYPGVCAGASVLLAVVTNLSLLPALLLHFPRFWTRALYEPPYLSLTRAAAAAAARLGWPPASPRAAPAEVTGGGAPEAGMGVSTAEPQPAGSPLWRALAVRTQRWRLTVVVLLIALLVAPFAPHLAALARARGLVGWEGSVPRGAASLRAFEVARERLGTMYTVETTSLLGVARNSSSPGVLSDPELFAAVGAASRAAAAASPGTTVTSVAYLGGASGMGDVPLSLVQWALNLSCPADRSCPSACPELACLGRKGVARSVSPDGRAVLIALAPTVDSFTAEGYAWALAQRTFAANLSASDPFMEWIYIGGAGCLLADLVTYVYAQLPTVLGTTIAVLFAVLGLSFRSLVIPLRTVVSNAVMLIAVFGAAAAVFEVGVLNRDDTFTNRYGLAWFVPILGFSICLGLGVDYDVFVVSAILRERQAGWDDASAIVRGVELSGPVISWAGVIMAVAFGGMLFASQPQLRELSFLIVFGVVLDAFVVRLLLVPAMHGLLGAWVWWPRRMPASTRSLAELPESAQAKGG